MTPWILVSIFSLLIVLLVLVLIFKKKIRKEPDYYALFIIGVIWLIAGIPIKMYSLSIIGLVFAIVGWVHKKDWEKNRRRWSTMNQAEKRLYLLMIIILAFLALAGLVIFLLAERGIILL